MEITQTTNTPTVSEQATSALQGTSRLLRMPEVLSLTGIQAKSTLYDMVRRGAFPKPVKIGRMSYWPAEAVHRWIDTVLGVAGAA